MKSNINKISDSIKIMVVDDVPESIRALARILKTNGFKVILVTSGEAVKELVLTNKPDIILLDIIMPGFNGLEICRNLKEDLNTANIPVIFISGLDHIKDKTRGFEAGAVDYISKPFDAEEILLRVKSAIKMSFMQRELSEKAKKMADIIEVVDLATWEWNPRTDDLSINDRWAEILGYSKGEFAISRGKEIHDWMHPNDWNNESIWLDKLLQKEIELFDIEIRFKHKAGYWVWVSIKAKVSAWDSSGLPLIVNGTMLDITKRKNSELKLFHSEKRHAELRAQSGIFDWEVDEKGLYTFVDNNCEFIIGYKPEELVQKKHFYDISPENERDELKKNAIFAMGTKQPFENFENIVMTKKGRLIFVSTNGIPLLDEKGNLLGYRGSDTDITARKKKEDEIFNLSYHDHLTGLYNRRFSEDELIRLNTESNLPITIVMGDVNGLKLVNDSFGHSVGDELLKKAALVMEKVVRNGDVIVRWGGDEFVIILPKTDAAEAEKMTTIINDMASTVKVEGISLSITFGNATKTAMQQDIHSIIKEAEDELYRHKIYNGSGMRSDTVQLIINTLYEKNHREMLHSKRVSEICEAIAIQMNYKKDDVSKMRIAGIMHDIGKIGINESILNKTGKLTDDEWREMKKHSEIGFRILSSVSEFREIADYVLEHQEKWDGTGYPRGLKGAEISSQARIIAVADAYDAMSSIRTYGVKLSKSDTENELRRCSGTQFDPEIVEVFLDKVINTL